MVISPCSYLDRNPEAKARFGDRGSQGFIQRSLFQMAQIDKLVNLMNEPGAFNEQIAHFGAKLKADGVSAHAMDVSGFPSWPRLLEYGWLGFCISLLHFKPEILPFKKSQKK